MSKSPAGTKSETVDDTPDNLPATNDETSPEYELDPDWEHDRINFAGDNLAVRAPTQQALAGFSLASSKYVSTEVKNDMTGLFIVEHIGPDSYGRVMQRLMDGDDTDYDSETLGLLMREIVLLTTNAVTTEE
jgi:hypothetical protein